MKADVQAARTEHAPLQAKLDKANTNKEMVHYTMTKEVRLNIIHASRNLTKVWYPNGLPI